MNIENLTKVAEWLEAGAKQIPGTDITGFNMRDFFAADHDNDCGTTCCIAGFIIAASGNQNRRDGYTIPAQELYGLTWRQADALFFGGEIRLASVTPAWAARCVRKLIAANKVDWLGTQEDA